MAFVNNFQLPVRFISLSLKYELTLLLRVLKNLALSILEKFIVLLTIAILIIL